MHSSMLNCHGRIATKLGCIAGCVGRPLHDRLFFLRNTSKRASVETIIVQPVDNARCKYILSHCTTDHIELLFCCSTDAGRTFYMQQAFMHLPKDTYMQLLISFSAHTHRTHTQALVDAKLGRRRMGVWGPSLNKKCVLCLTFWICG